MKMHVLALGLMLSVLVVACGGRKTAQDAEGAAPESAESAGKATAGAEADDDDGEEGEGDGGGLDP